VGNETTGVVLLEGKLAESMSSTRMLNCQLSAASGANSAAGCKDKAKPGCSGATGDGSCGAASATGSGGGALPTSSFGALVSSFAPRRLSFCSQVCENAVVATPTGCAPHRVLAQGRLAEGCGCDDEQLNSRVSQHGPPTKTGASEGKPS